MCYCDKPIINGQLGYKWQPNDAPGVYPLNPPPLDDNDVLLFDEPGRCGGCDSHSFHFRVVKHWDSLYLLVRHGGGDERITLPDSADALEPILVALDSSARYWLLCAIYHVHSQAKRDGRDETTIYWQTAAAEKRIKTRKMPHSGMVRVRIDPVLTTHSATNAF